MSKAQIVSVFLFGSQLLSPKKNNDTFFSCPVFYILIEEMCIFHLLALLNAVFCLFCCSL